MMTTSEQIAVDSANTTTRVVAATDGGAVLASDRSSKRYADELVSLHGRLTYLGLERSIEGEPIVRLSGFGDGLTTLSVRESQLPERYTKGILGFRLAQFLLVGFMDPELAYREALFHEPITERHGPETIHTVTLTETGKIVGYLGFVGAPDPEPMPLDSPDRVPFDAEEAHHVELLSRYARPSLTSHHAYEIKRFARDASMPRGIQRDRVAWHLVLSAGRTLVALRDDMRIVLGDAREKGAIRHLNLTGFDLEVIENAQPSLTHDQLMWPSYEVPHEKRAKPFVAPVRDDLSDYMDAIEEGLHDGDGWLRELLTRLGALRGAAGSPDKRGTDDRHP